MGRGVVVIGGAVVYKEAGLWRLPSRYNRYLSRLADAFGHVVFFAELTQSRATSHPLTDERIEIVPNPFSGLSTLQKLAEMVRFSLQLRQYLDKIPRVIHVFPAGKVPLGLASIVTSGATHLTYFKSDWIKWTMGRPGLSAHKAAFWYLSELAECRLADAMVFRDQEHLNRLRRVACAELELASPLLAVEGNGEVLARYRNCNASTAEPVKLLYVGGLYKPKGLEELAEALGRLYSEGHEFSLDLVGAATGRTAGLPTWLDDALTHHDVHARVTPHGFVDDPDQLSALFRQSDALVLPSHTEGFPRVVDEAMSFGLPVVCTSVGGIPSRLLHRRDALLVAPKDVAALTDALRDVIVDADLRMSLAQAAKASFDRRVAETAAEQHIRLLCAHG